MLSQRERRVLELRYGLNGERPRTLDEVGRTFNVTRERIRQIENQTLKKLRALADAQKLRDVAVAGPSGRDALRRPERATSTSLAGRAALAGVPVRELRRGRPTPANASEHSRPQASRPYGTTALDGRERGLRRCARARELTAHAPELRRRAGARRPGASPTCDPRVEAPETAAGLARRLRALRIPASAPTRRTPATCAAATWVPTSCGGGRRGGARRLGRRRS